MTGAVKNVWALVGSALTTFVLFLFLLLGTISGSQEKQALVSGSIRLSQLENEQVDEEEVYSATDVPQVEAFDEVQSAMDTSLDQPRLEMEMPSMELDMAAELAGTLPMAGLNSLAAFSTLGSPSGGALTLGEVDEKPKVLYAPLPLYPASQKARGTELKVVVRIRLRTDGTVAEAKPLRQTPESKPFHDAAVQAVEAWHFMPCRKDGKAVMCIADQSVSFTLNR